MSLNSGTGNTTPLFQLWPREGSAYLTGGTLSLSGTPLGAWIISAGNQGSRIRSVEVDAANITQSSMVRLQLCDTAGLTGITWREYAVGIVSATVTSSGYHTADYNFDKILPSGWTVRAILATAGPSAYVHVSLGDF